MLALAFLPLVAWAQFGVVAPLHVNGNQLNDQYGNKVVLHGVMDTPSPYFNHNRWGYTCTDNNVQPCINYYDKVFGALQNPAKGTYCNIFRLHLEPGWTNDPNKQSTGSETGEANISRFSATRLQKYLDMLYWPLAQKALNHGMYVVMRPPGVCPKELKVGDYYQDYLKTVWNIVSSNTNVKNNAGVVSIELANEPVHIKNQYGQTSATAMRDYFQPIIDIIRRNGFTGIIWVPGMGYQSQYQDYAQYPVNDNNYGYAVHVYPGWYGASDTSYDHQAFIRNFQKQVPVVTSKPILVSEIDWSPEQPGSGKYNEFGQWVASNYGTWGTASTSKWGNAWKSVMDYFGNISMTLTSIDDYLDVDAFLRNGTVKAAFNENTECCAKACFYWYYEYSQKNYAHSSGNNNNNNSSNNNNNSSNNNNNNNNNNSSNNNSNTTANTTQGDNLIPSWGDGNDFIPQGWTVCDNGSEVQPGNVSRGPRVMKFTGGGDFSSAFYAREISADRAGFIEYGSKSGYALSLVYGEYVLACNVAAWKGSPYVKIEVFDPAGSVLASRIVQANGNANGNTATKMQNTTVVGMSFYSMIKGNYRVRFTPVADANGNGGAWQEALIANVSLYYKGNPLAFRKQNEVPAGWKIVDADQEKPAGEAASGPRIFQFAGGGEVATGLYIRQSDASKAGYAEYGSTNGYAMTLKAGQYNLSYNAVAWAGTPYIKCEVFNQNNQCIGSQIIRCDKNVNKNLSANTYGSSYGVVNFNAAQTGNYRFRWTPCADQWGAASTWVEVVFGHIKISQGYAARTFEMDDETTGIQDVQTTNAEDDVWYDLHGQKVEQPTRSAEGRLFPKGLKKGLYIHNGKKVFVK